MNPHAHEPIVDESIFLAAQRPAPNLNGRESRHGFWLSKVTRCAGCGGALVGSHVKPRKGAKFPFYRCVTRGCPEPASISAAKLEGYVKDELELVAGTLEEVDDRPLDDGLDELVLDEQRLARELEAWRRLPIADLDPAFYAEGLRERLEPLEAGSRAGRSRTGGPRVGSSGCADPEHRALGRLGRLLRRGEAHDRAAGARPRRGHEGLDQGPDRGARGPELWRCRRILRETSSAFAQDLP